jgi:TonB family protein
MILLILASYLLSFFMVIQSGSPQWKEYTSLEGKFTVLLPGEPLTAQYVSEESLTKITYVKFLKRPGVAYDIAYYDTSHLVTEPEKIKDLLDSTRDKIIARHSLKVINESEKTWKEYPGRSLRMETNDGKTFLLRIHLIKQRVYYLSAVSYLDKNEPIDAEKFFESFKPMLLTDEELKNLAVKSKSNTENAIPRKITGGVLPGLAIRKVTPTYPADARKARISGAVQVQVLISEEGKVISAEIIEGPEELREASLNAAKQWVFKPTILEGIPVKVQGILTFNFALQ